MEMNKDASELLYMQKVKDEIYPVNPDGESLAKLEMIAEIKSIDPSITCFTDIELGPKIKNDTIANIVLRYFYRMESCYTKETILRKINANKHPEIVEMAIEEYNSFSSFEKTYMTGLQEVICNGIKSNANYILSLINTPDDYAAGLIIRQKMIRMAPEIMKPLSFNYCRGLLLIETIPEFYAYKDSVSINKLLFLSTISENDLKEIISNSPYKLCVTFMEKYSKQTTVSSIRSLSKSFLKKYNVSDPILSGSNL